MTAFVTIEAQELQNLGFTANTVSESSAEDIDAWTLKYTTGLFIQELADKASEFQDMSKRTDAYLYSLLQECFEDFQILSQPSSNLASNAQAALDKHCKKNGIKFGAEAQLLGKFLKCIFVGADRSKISTYGYVLKFALKQNVAKGELANVIRAFGGIQKIKKASFVAISLKTKENTTKKLHAAQANLQRTVLGTVEVPLAKSAITKLKTGDSIVLIATIDNKRKFVIRALTSNESVINAAVLAASSTEVAVQPAAETVLA